MKTARAGRLPDPVTIAARGRDGRGKTGERIERARPARISPPASRERSSQATVPSGGQPAVDSAAKPSRGQPVIRTAPAVLIVATPPVSIRRPRLPDIERPRGVTGASAPARAHQRAPRLPLTAQGGSPREGGYHASRGRLRMIQGGIRSCGAAVGARGNGEVTALAGGRLGRSPDRAERANDLPPVSKFLGSLSECWPSEGRLSRAPNIPLFPSSVPPSVAIERSAIAYDVRSLASVAGGRS